MADTVAKRKRSEIMKAIKSSGTAFEKNFEKVLKGAGYKFQKNVKGLIGKPDIVFMEYKLVVFLDSCFWHGCKQHCRFPNSNKVYWRNKIQRNKNRDKEVNKFYRQKEWKLLRIWEHQIKNNSEECLNIFKKILIK